MKRVGGGHQATVVQPSKCTHYEGYPTQCEALLSLSGSQDLRFLVRAGFLVLLEQGPHIRTPLLFIAEDYFVSFEILTHYVVYGCSLCIPVVLE